MAPLTKFLYRILRSNCRAVFLPHNREFLQSSLHSCQESLMLLSRGFPIVNNLPNNPYLELERAFREGNEDDIQILFTVLPSLLRYSRAATLIEKHFQSLSPLKFNRGKSYSALDDPNMLTGALLISKLYYTEKELHQRSINTIVKEGLKELRTLLKSELEKELLHRHDIKKVLNESISLPKGTGYEKKRSQVLALINALDRAIIQQERRRDRDPSASIVHLVDQVLQPEGAYSRATPITYSILYATVINAIANLGDHNLQAVGINFPQRFLTRIVVKNSPLGHMHRHNQTVVNSEDFIKSGPAQFSRRKDLQNVPKEINFMDLLGDWVGFYSEGMQEVRIQYRKDKDKNTRVLEAVKIDSDQNLPAGEIAWSIDLNQISKKSKLLAMNTPYQVNVQVALPGYTHVQLVPYTLTIVVLPASIFQPASDVALAHLLAEQTQDSDAPYFELQLVPVEPERVEEGFTDHSVPSDAINNSTAQAMRSIHGGTQSASTFAPTTIARTYNSSNTHPSLRSQASDPVEEDEVRGTEGSARYSTGPRLTQRRSPVLRSPASGRNTVASTDLGGGLALESLSFCRTVDLDRCLLDISDKGVTPLTPTTYLALMNA